MNTSTKTKPSIVFCHGIWADGSCFSKVIPALQAEGYEVMAAQYGLDTNEGDVAMVKRTLGRTRETSRSRSKNLSGRPIMRRRQSCSAEMPLASPGNRSRVGISWPTTTARFTRICTGSWRSVWAQPPTLSTAATSRCCPAPAWLSTLSEPPQKPFKDHSLRREGSVVLLTPLRSVRGHTLRIQGECDD